MRSQHFSDLHRLLFAGVLFAGVSGALGPSAYATMPPNPDRATNVRTCDDAIRNLRIAVEGSPMLSAAENMQRIKAASALVEVHCSRSQKK